MGKGMRGGVCKKRYGGWGRGGVRNGWGEGAVEEMNEGRGEGGNCWELHTGGQSGGQVR